MDFDFQNIPTVNIPISKLEENKGQIEGVPRNPRVVKDANLKKLVKSIQEDTEFLSLNCLHVFQQGKKYVVCNGNMRLKACRELGLKVVPCKVIPPDTTVEKLKRYIMKDNIDAGEWDWGAIHEEWDAAQLDDWGVEVPDMGFESEPTASEDDFDETKDAVETVCKKGDIWLLGEHRLMCGDSTDVSNVQLLMGGVLADCVIIDPPYNVGVKNSQGMTIQNDNMGNTEFRAFLTGAFKAVKKVMKNGCPFYVWFASKEHINFESSLNANGLSVRQELIWNKNHFILGRSHYQYQHEPCLYGWKGDSCAYFTDKRNNASVIQDSKELNIDKMKATEMRELLHRIYETKLPTTIINENKPNVDSDHPTMKPVRLIGYIMKNSSKIGDKILDTFGGSGTTLIAAEQLGRKCYMMELDEHYCDVIIARWEKLTGKKATKEARP